MLIVSFRLSSLEVKEYGSAPIILWQSKLMCHGLKCCMLNIGQTWGSVCAYSSQFSLTFGVSSDIWVVFTPLAQDKVGILKSFSRSLIPLCSPSTG